MRRFTICLAIALTTCGACGASQAPETTPEVTEPTETTETETTIASQIDAWIAENAEGIELRVDQGELRVRCPIGVRCDRDFDYFAVAGGNPRVYVSFDPAVLDGVSLESLREHFRYLNYSVPALERGSWRVMLGPDGLSRREAGEVTIDGYTDGRLQLTLRTTVTRLRGDDRDCQVPADATMPAECFDEREVQIPLVIHVDLPMPTEGVDCTDGGPSCG